MSNTELKSKDLNKIRITLLKETYAFCPICDDMFSSKERNEHILTKHRDKVCFCRYCKKHIINTPLFPHHHSKKGCMCITCMKEVMSKFNCKLCNKFFIYEFEFIKHNKIHR